MQAGSESSLSALAEVDEPANGVHQSRHEGDVRAFCEGDGSAGFGAQPFCMTKDERHRVLVEWNATDHDYPRDKCAHQLLEAQVAITPDAVAVFFGNQQMTFGELDRRSNLLACRLVELGVGPEVHVGLHCRRSPEMVVGIFGILKAGGAYVPLDPDYPAERLAFMLEDCGAKVLLTQRCLESIPGNERIATAFLDELLDVDIATIETTTSSVGPRNVAYVIYTSGSTGIPKGVVVTHGGLVNYLNWSRRAYPLSRVGATPVHSSISFDLTVTSLWVPLVAGRAIRLIPHGFGIEPLAAAMQESRFGLVKITPAHLRLLNQAFSSCDAADRASAFVIGGENLLYEDIAFWQEFAPLTVLINEYGPTETVVGCCTYEASASERKSGSVPIGRPIDNTQLYVLDEQLEPVPIGVAGELFIGGAGVARGYLNRPRLTAERFVPNPFGSSAGARLYRTGDRVRYQNDGNLVFLGRTDNQVKVGGYRIEPGEIEAVLNQHPKVRESAVVVRRDRAGENRLVGYVVPRAGTEIAIAEIRNFAQRSLPEYMVPSTLKMLNSFPLTVSGKVDREALPEPAHVRGGDGSYVAPRNPLEHRLASIWEDSLGLRPIGINDDIFELGVSSLLSVQLFARIQEEFGRTESLELLLQAPTIEKLARRLQQNESTSQCVSLVLLRDGAPGLPFYCVHGGGGTIFLLRRLARELGDNRPFYGLQARAWNDRYPADTTVEEMASHYVHEIRTVQPRGPYLLAGYCFGGIVAFEMARQLRELGEEVRLLIALNAPNSTNAARLNPNSEKSSDLRPALKPPVDRPRESVSGTMELIRKIRAGLTWRFRLLVARTRWKLIPLRIRVRMALGLSLPTQLRFHHLLALSQRAEQIYSPKPASIPVVVFRSDRYYLDEYLGSDPELGWRVLASQHLEVQEISCAGNDRRDLLEEPAVYELGALLRERLDRAEAEYMNV